MFHMSLWYNLIFIIAVAHRFITLLRSLLTTFGLSSSILKRAITADVSTRLATCEAAFLVPSQSSLFCAWSFLCLTIVIIIVIFIFLILTVIWAVLCPLFCRPHLCLTIILLLLVDWMSLMIIGRVISDASMSIASVVTGCIIILLLVVLVLVSLAGVHPVVVATLWVVLATRSPSWS